MISKILHYVWLGGKPLTPLAEECLASWKATMPDWQIMRWDEASLSQALCEPNPNPCPKGKGEETTHGSTPQDEHCWLDYMPTYVKQAYETRKFAFVSDYVRLWALEQYGGLYMDVDFMVFRPLDDLMGKYPAFAGYEGSKRQPVMQGVIASEPHGAWVRDMLQTYQHREFIKPDGSLDLTPNTTYFSDRLEAQGFIPDGKEKDVIVNGEFFLHVMPVWAFCPVLTTGEDVRTAETYCEHLGESSWAEKGGWKAKVLKWFGPKWKTRIIKLKRKLLG